MSAVSSIYSGLSTAAWNAVKNVRIQKVLKVALMALAFFTAAPLVRGNPAAQSGPIQNFKFTDRSSSCLFNGPLPNSFSYDPQRSQQAIQLRNNKGIVCHLKQDVPSIPVGVRLAALLNTNGTFNIPCYRSLSFTANEQTVTGYCSRHEENCKQLHQLQRHYDFTGFPVDQIQQMVLLSILWNEEDMHYRNILVCGATPRIVVTDLDSSAFNLVDLVGEVLGLPHPFAKPSDLVARSLPPGPSYNGLSKSPLYLESPWAKQGVLPQLSSPLDPKLKKWIETVNLESHRSSFKGLHEQLAFDGFLLQILTAKEILGGQSTKNLQDYIDRQREDLYEKAVQKTVALLKPAFKGCKNRGKCSKEIRSRFFKEYPIQLRALIVANKDEL